MVSRRQSDRKKQPNLSGSINFGLPNILALSEHRSSHELVPILSASQLCGFQENSRPIVPREGFPLFLCGKSAVNGITDYLLVSFMIVAQVSRVIRRNWLIDDFAGLDLRWKRRNRSVVVRTERATRGMDAQAFR